MANTYFKVDPKTGVATIDLFTNAHGALAEPNYRLYLHIFQLNCLFLSEQCAARSADQDVDAPLLRASEVARGRDTRALVL